MPRLLVVCVTVLLGACAPSSPSTFESICVSPEFSPNHQEAIFEAIDKWFYALPERAVRVAICDGSPGALVISESDDPECEGELSGRHMKSSRGQEIELCPESAPSTHRAALHEFGHALGAHGHLPPGNVMSEFIHGARLTVHDVMFVRDHQ